MVVAKDTDVFSLERAGVFKGYYVVLGGLLPIVGEGSIREDLLKYALSARRNLVEVILALPATPEGDQTSDRVRDIVRNVKPSVTLSLLGRGLATGTEVEYSDKETLRSALQNRK
jgi:recombination protein RecR